MDKIDKKIKDKYNNEYIRISKYTNLETPFNLKHLVCGNNYNVKPHEFFRNNNTGRCPYCYSSKNITKEMFQWKLDNVYNHTKNKGYTVLKFDGMNNKCTIEHKCGNKWTPKPREIKQGKGCPICSHRSFTYDPEYVKNEIHDITNGEYIVLSDYRKENIPIKVRHEKCGHEFFPTRRNFIYKHTRCPKCYRLDVISKGAKLIENTLNNNDIAFDTEAIFAKCKNKRTLPFDFKINDILIEYDGSQHFFKRRDDNSGQKLIETKKHDHIKNNFVKNQSSLKLIRIPYNTSFQVLEKIINELSVNIKNNEIDILSATTIEQNNLLLIDNTIDETYYTKIISDYFIT